MDVNRDESTVTVPLDRAIEVARFLECLTRSIDRIGSRMAGGLADAGTVDRFIDEWLIGPQASRARRVLWDAISQVIGEEAVEGIAEAVPRFPGAHLMRWDGFDRSCRRGRRRSMGSRLLRDERLAGSSHPVRKRPTAAGGVVRDIERCFRW